jgi:transcriptional regulator with XRE-family HTH domain
MLDAEEFDNFFSERIAQLRMAKSVSARDMSLCLGQGAGYINSIENKKSLPSMRGFFYICEYFNIAPRDFFDAASAAPEKLNEIMADMKCLKAEQLSSIANIIKDLSKLNNKKINEKIQDWTNQ